MIELLQCVQCGAELHEARDQTICHGCNEVFKNFRDKPILIGSENHIFLNSSYIEVGVSKKAASSVISKLKRLIPKKSINLARDRLFARLSSEYGDKGKTILVVGCGNQTSQLEKHFANEKTNFVFCDIDKNADTDIFCDAHELAFKKNLFDGVISTAVMEHVLYPERVIKEIHRVLKEGGFIYSEIPFLQSVHEGAYGFTRYTMSGHRRLLEQFEEIDTGMVAGPGTALVWGIVDFSKAVFSNRRLSSAAGLAARLFFFWLKYLDYIVENSPRALDSASCTYFYGRKSHQTVNGLEIISRYEGDKYLHS
jgi:SAM-dependent methyltransferase